MMKVFPLIAMYYSLNEEMDLNDLDLHCPYCFYDFSPSETQWHPTCEE
jgi:hypothetical protein